MAVIDLLTAVREGLRASLRDDPSTLIMGEDIGVKGGVFRATEGLQAEFGLARVIDTPIAELGFVGIAIGAAMCGLKPIVEIQFADYIHPAWDQIVNEAARIRYRSDGAYGCPIVVRAPYGAGVRGGLYHSQSVEAFFCHVPGLKVVAPSTPADAYALIQAAVQDPDPVIYLEHKRCYRAVKGEVPGEPLPLGRAAVRRAGRHASLFAWGWMLHQSLQAAETLASEDFEVEVVDLCTLRPLDREAILASVRRTSRALVVHEDNLMGGLGAEIAALIAHDAFADLDAPVSRLGMPEVPATPYSGPLEDFVLPNAERIAAALRDLLRY